MGITSIPCFGKELEFIRPVLIDLNRLSDENINILEDLKKDCRNICNYNHEYAEYEELKNDSFVLRVGSMALCIIVKKTQCIVIEIVQLVENI